jgi:hypothetical protein
LSISKSLQLSQGVDANNVVASAAERQGNFSDILPKTIKGPLTGRLSPGNTDIDGMAGIQGFETTSSIKSFRSARHSMRAGRSSWH